jgi:RhtB (resistance to homoserine/threonine) family protein
MEYLNQFLIIAVAHVFAMLSPGPDIAIILRQSITQGRRKAILTALGISSGISVHLTYILLGFGLIVSKSIVVYTILKYLAAIYLIYLGIKILKSSTYKLEDKDKKENMSDFKAYRIGLFTNLLNPKVTLYFLALFTVVVTPETPFNIQLAYCLFFTVGTFLIFSLFSCFFSANKVKRFFNSFGKYFDRTMAVILIILGIKIAID